MGLSAVQTLTPPVDLGHSLKCVRKQSPLDESRWENTEYLSGTNEHVCQRETRLNCARSSLWPAVFVLATAIQPALERFLNVCGPKSSTNLAHRFVCSELCVCVCVGQPPHKRDRIVCSIACICLYSGLLTFIALARQKDLALVSP